jgi:hypothetical protein
VVGRDGDKSGLHDYHEKLTMSSYSAPMYHQVIKILDELARAPGRVPVRRLFVSHSGQEAAGTIRARPVGSSSCTHARVSSVEARIDRE